VKSISVQCYMSKDMYVQNRLRRQTDRQTDRQNLLLCPEMSTSICREHKKSYLDTQVLVRVFHANLNENLIKDLGVKRCK
jgi:hypothetical protein